MTVLDTVDHERDDARCVKFNKTEGEVVGQGKPNMRVPLLANANENLLFCPICGVQLAEGETDFLWSFHSRVCDICGERARTDDSFFWHAWDLLNRA